MVRPFDPPAIIEFGRFGILPHRRQLLADGRPIRLGGRSFDLLLALLEAPGAVVGKDELLSRIWPGRIVEENRLQSEIWALRKVFGADRDLIQTVAGRGYQFTGEIRELGAGVSPRQVAAPSAIPASLNPAINPSESASGLIGRKAGLSEVTDHVTQVARQQPLASAEGTRVTKHEAAERRQITAMSCGAIGVAARADGIGLEGIGGNDHACQHCASEIVGRCSGFVASRPSGTASSSFSAIPRLHEARRRAGRSTPGSSCQARQ